jgi:hypothetical protein
MQHSVSTTVEKTFKSTRNVECGAAGATAGVSGSVGTMPVRDGGKAFSEDKRIADRDEIALAIRATRP